MNIILKTIIYLLFILAANILLYLAAFYYKKTEQIGISSKEYYKKFLIFGPIYYLYIVFQHKKYSNNETSESNKLSADTNKIKSLLLFFVYVVFLFCFIVFVVLNIKSAYFNKKYYDLYHNEYSSKEAVVYYSKDGKSYNCINDEFCFVEIGNPENIIDAGNCYIDKDGYFVIIDNSTVDFDESVPVENPYCFYDMNNNYYADAIISYWNSSGELVKQGFEEHRRQIFVIKNN